MTREQALSDPRVLAGTHRPVRIGWLVVDIAKELARQARYRKTDKGRAKDARYQKTEKRRVVMARYQATPNGHTRRLLNNNLARSMRQDTKDAALIAEIDKQLTHILGGN